jgi:SPRY domain-containing SOCS box protein 3
LTDATAVLSNDDRNVLFNPGFSVGTVAVRGNTPFANGYHHYFEIEMVTEVYGTAMMIGVGTDKTDLKRFSHSFVCLIGYDEESWGLSYNGTLHHNGTSSLYTKSFTQGSVIGVHLDLWQGTLEYYLNRKPLGKAFTLLKNKVLYPMVSSTSARSGMNLTYSCSFAPTLQLQTLLSLGRQTFWPENVSIFKCHDLPPGLKMWIKNNFWWVVCNANTGEEKEDEKEKESGRKTGAIEQGRPRSSQGVRRKKVPSENGDAAENSGDVDEGATSQAQEVQPGTSGTTTNVPENKRQRLRSSFSQQGQ